MAEAEGKDGRVRGRHAMRAALAGGVTLLAVATLAAPTWVVLAARHQPRFAPAALPAVATSAETGATGTTGTTGAIRPAHAATAGSTTAGTATALAADHWSTLPAAPIPVWTGGIVWTGSQLVGWDDGSAPADDGHLALATYDPATQIWTRPSRSPLPAMPATSGHDLGAVSIAVADGRLLGWQEWVHSTAVGADGRQAEFGTDAMWCDGCPAPWETDPRVRIFDATADTWTALPHDPVAGNSSYLWTGTAVVDVDGGGFVNADGTTTPRGAASAYDLATSSWRRLPDAPLAGTDVVAVWAGDRVLEWGELYRPTDVIGPSGASPQPAGLSLGP